MVCETLRLFSADHSSLLSHASDSRGRPWENLYSYPFVDEEVHRCISSILVAMVIEDRVRKLTHTSCDGETVETSEDRTLC